MIKDKGIVIQNIYYMLTYAFRVLQKNNFAHIAGEPFEHIHDLFAAILAEGVAAQLKQGLHRQYQERLDSLPLHRGKLAFNDTIKNRMQRKALLGCEFDELSENNIYNQILKTTLTLLGQNRDVSRENKSKIHRVLLFFRDILGIEPCSIKWNTLHISRGNQNYRMLMNLCHLILTGLLMTTEEGSYRLMELSDKNMNLLYERFILEYYKKHHPYLRPNARTIHWLLEDGPSDHLPIMQTDTTLQLGDKTLIIDAKYYGHSMRKSFDKHVYHSHNLYQIFSYVKNLDRDQAGKVSGMLLYAKTSERVTPDEDLVISGNKISIKTLDLNQPFQGIKDQLEGFITQIGV